MLYIYLGLNERTSFNMAVYMRDDDYDHIKTDFSQSPI